MTCAQIETLAPLEPIPAQLSEQRKTCFKCGQVKPLNEFYRHAQMADGRLNKCKDCTKADVRANRRENIRHYQEYDRQRFNDPKRRQKSLADVQRARREHPEKYRARMAVNNAIRDGRLFPRPCVDCGATVKLEAHHEDYGRPLDVTWLCFVCHRRRHGQEPVENAA